MGAKPVAIVMGSQSDWATLRHAAETLSALGVQYDARIVSAHRTPDRLVAFAKGARAAGAPERDLPRALLGGKTGSIAPSGPIDASMNTADGLVPEPCDFVLHQQLAALELGDLEIVGRRMGERLGEFRLECPVPFLQFRKMRLDGHVRVLLGQIASLTGQVCHEVHISSTVQ